MIENFQQFFYYLRNMETYYYSNGEIDTIVGDNYTIELDEVDGTECGIGLIFDKNQKIETVWELFRYSANCELLIVSNGEYNPIEIIYREGLNFISIRPEEKFTFPLDFKPMSKFIVDLFISGNDKFGLGKHTKKHYFVDMCILSKKV